MISVNKANTIIMGQQLTDYNTLLKQAKEKGLYEKLVAQLNKDFLRSNIHSTIQENIPAVDLYVLLKEKMYRLMMEDFNGYLNFMYVVDVPEASFKTVSVTDAVEVAEQVSFLVLKREFQKVGLKQTYRDNS